MKRVFLLITFSIGWDAHASILSPWNYIKQYQLGIDVGTTSDTATFNFDIDPATYSDTENCTSIEDQFINNQMAINIDSNKRWLDWYEKNLITGPLRIIQPTIHQQIHRSNNKSGIYRRYQPYVENTNIEIINPVVIMPEGTQARNQGETRTPKTKTIVLNMESLKALPEMQNLQIMTPNI